MLFLFILVAIFDFSALLNRKGENHHPAPVDAKGGESMNPTFEERIQNQFGSFCIKVLKNEARAIHRERTRLYSAEQSLSDLSNKEIIQTATNDAYFMNDHVFIVIGRPIVVTGDNFASAIARLPKEKRDVILLYYYLGMSDRSISKQLCVIRLTITKRRTTALRELRKYLQEEGAD